MPKYTLPKNEPSAEDVPSIPQAHLFIPANKEIIEELEVDEPAEILMRVKIRGLESRESNVDADRYEFSVELIEYEIYGEKENAFSQMAREDEK